MTVFSRREFLGAAATLLSSPKLGFSTPGFPDYLDYDALGLADLVRRKEVTPEELLEAAIARVDAIDPVITISPAAVQIPASIRMAATTRDSTASTVALIVARSRTVTFGWSRTSAS